ncbi:hypothetical protein BK010_09640 [Tenericutes bacterium MO-XQ]|nr:hypothetical protein BK010_09640 [Tenericutes bacterium MO-XQ]
MNTLFETLKRKNESLELYAISHESFKAYGNILDSKHFLEYFKYLDQYTSIPEKDNIYIAHDNDILKNLKDDDSLNRIFGFFQFQTGYVNGHNTKLNALEYHKSSEVIVALTPVVLLLGLHEDIKNQSYDTKSIKAFYIPEYTVIELHPRVLHFSPCKTMNSGFKCGIVLPMGTNTEFIKLDDVETEEDLYLFKTNKWLLVHKEHQKMIDLGAYVGIIGKNIEIKY